MKGVFELLKNTVREFLDDNCPTMAASISYYTVFALPPLLVLVLTLVGMLVDSTAAERRIVAEARALIGPDAGAMVQTMIQQASQPRGGLSAVLGVAALLFGATGAFMQLQRALNVAWDVPKQERKGGIVGMLVKRLLSLGMILGIGFLLLVSMLLSAMLSAAGDAAGAYLPGALSSGLLYVLELLVSFVLIAVLFAAIFRFLPDIRLAWRHVALGGVFTAVLFVLGKFALSFYLGQSAPGSSFGAAGALAAILVWIYYSSMILLLGAELTQVWTRRHGEEPPLENQ